MKNEEIHKGFNQSEIRDLLARELRDSKKRGGIGGDYTEKYLEEQIESMKETLKYVRKTNALQLLVEEMGWEEWDISEYVPYNEETYFSFIGTEKEYNELAKILNEENVK